MIIYKRLGATEVTANTNTLLYTVPTATSSVVSSIVACNIGLIDITFRIAIIQGDISTVANKDYIYYDLGISSKDTFIATTGFTLSAGDTIMVRSNHADIVFSVFGSEIS